MFKIYVVSLFVILLKFSSGLSPVIIIPGGLGSKLEARLNKTDAVDPFCFKQNPNFQIWVNPFEFLPIAIDCSFDNLRLIYDNVTRKTTSPPGVEIRAQGWGTTEAVEYLDLWNMWFGGYFNDIVKALVNIGYKKDISIRAAPYDFRKGPNEQTEFFENLKALVEDTYTTNGNVSITLITHSAGGSMAYHFLKMQTQEWKDQYIKRLIALGTPWGGTMKALRVLAIGDDYDHKLFFYRMKIRTLARTVPSVTWMLPSPLFWNATDVLVQTSDFNYTSNDLQKLFLDMDLPNAWEMRKDTYSDDFSAPGVELHCLYGTGTPTDERLVYNGGLDKWPTVTMGEGDGTVNIRSLTACERWKEHGGLTTPNQGYPIQNVPLANVDHLKMMSDSKVKYYILDLLIKKEERMKNRDFRKLERKVMGKKFINFISSLSH